MDPFSDLSDYNPIWTDKLINPPESNFTLDRVLMFDGKLQDNDGAFFMIKIIDDSGLKVASFRLDSFTKSLIMESDFEVGEVNNV